MKNDGISGHPPVCTILRIFVDDLIVITKDNEWQILFITACKRSCDKVMFLHLSVSRSVHRRRGLCMMLLLSDRPPRQNPLDRDPPEQRPPLDRDPLNGKERAVRILLECILVLFLI